MATIDRLTALEILDSRGRPTIQATCWLKDDVSGTASVPSGASTGGAEALELRDGDVTRYRGLGCRQAVLNINETINNALTGKTFSNQSELDQALIDLDGTENKSRLGANAILGVSLAYARAVANFQKQPLYHHFADVLGQPLKTLPRPTINLFSGGKHAGGQVPVQDVLIVPASANNMDDALAMTVEVYQCAAELGTGKYDVRALSADEGGLAPPFLNTEAMLEDAVASIEAAGLVPGKDVALALDIASSHFYQDDSYVFENRRLDGDEMIELLCSWLKQYPIVSIEDGLSEEDWSHWSKLYAKVSEQTLVLGDDLLCTNSGRIQRAIDNKAANALLLKVNQIGSLSEAAQAYRLARSADWRVTISARSGETEDNWLADLAVGWCGDQIKIGSITQSERLAKYNRLLAIEAETDLPLIGWPNH